MKKEPKLIQLFNKSNQLWLERYGEPKREDYTEEEKREVEQRAREIAEEITPRDLVQLVQLLNYTGNPNILNEKPDNLNKCLYLLIYEATINIITRQLTHNVIDHNTLLMKGYVKF